ncbi:MAG: protein kinase domain-containing protein [Candidatus Sumerlaeaceae bacterium]
MQFAVWVLIAVLMFVGGQTRGEDFQLATKVTGLNSPNEPVLYDVDADGHFEVLLTGVNGEVAAYRLPSLSILWKTKLPAKGLTSAAIGDLLGTGEGIAVLGSGDGNVFFVRAGSGEILATLPLGKAVSVAPTILPAPDETTASAESAVVCDEFGEVHLVKLEGQTPWVVFSSPNTLESPTGEQISLGRVNYPASIADIDGDHKPEIVVGTALGKVVAISSTNPRTRYVWHGPQGLSIITNVAAGDFFGLGRDALVFGTNAGNLFAIAFDPATHTLKTAVGQLKLSGPANGHILAADFDGDHLPDVIAGCDNAVLSFAPAVGFVPRGQPYGANAPPFSPVALIALADKTYRALVIDGKGILHLIDPIKTSPSGSLALDTVANSTIVGGNLTNAGFPELVYLTKNRARLTYVGLTERKVSSEISPVLAMGSNFQRSGEIGTRPLAQLKANRERFAKLLASQVAEAKQLYDMGRYAECRATLARVLQAVADHREAISLERKAAFRQHWLLYVALMLLVAGTAGIGVWAVMRLRLHRSAIENVEKLIEIQAYPQAAALLQELRRKDPKNATFLRLLAKVYLLWERIGTDTIRVLEEAHRTFPDDSGITLALAKAYAETGVENEQALELYQIALAVMEGERGDIAYRAAKIFETKGNVEQAIRHYRLAEKEGCTAPDLQARLVELYLATHQFNEKTLPAFESMFSEYTQDARFLEGLCRAQAAARRVDDRARAAASSLLALKPDSVVALRQLAKCELQAGRHEKAKNFAERAFALEPNDDETALVLAFCYSALEFFEPKAREIYRRALALDPQNPTFLRCAALTDHTTLGRPLDETDFDILKRAVQANPNDVVLLRTYAEECRKRTDFTSAREALERLLELGGQSSAVYCSLAEVYALQGEFSSKAIPAYEEALAADPENATYLEALARSYIVAGRKDPAAIQLIEKALKKVPRAIELGVYLAKNYLETERYEDALKLARWLLERDKENEEIQKLFAQASFASNRLDEAIEQYQHVLAKHPDDSEALVNIALAFARKHRTDAEAAQRYTAALAVSPAQPLIRFMLARHHAMAGRYGAALDQLAEILRISNEHQPRLLDEVRLYLAHAPDRADLRWFCATLLTEMEHMDEACEEIENLLALEPGETKAILQAYDRILGKDPLNVTALVGKARLLRAMGNHEAAKPLLEQAHRISPKNADARNELKELYEEILQEKDETEIRFELAKLHFEEGAYDRAIALFQKTVLDFRFENESIKMLARCFMEKGMLEFAFQELRKLLIDDEVKELLYTLAQRYEAKNDFVGAKQVYRVLFAADMNYRDVKHRFEMLAGATSDPLALDRSELITQLGERARSRYELVEELGRGAMGVVYRARDNELEEIVALKILPENLSQNPEALHRFRAEARAARRLSHPNIVRIHDIGEEKGRKYISMEFVRGTDLKRYLRQKGKLSIEEAISIILPLCDALDYAHSNSIVHRDIKPANIMITEQGVAKLSDFGIAKVLELTSETVTGAIIGTPLYMSPEQVQGQPVDHRADIYSLGITFYELLAGKPPFTEGDIAYQHCRVPARPIPGVPEELNVIILKCLEKDKEKRWASAAELAQALRSWFEKWQQSKPLVS